MSEVKPNSNGYWGATDGRGKLRVLECAVQNEKPMLLHKTWRTPDQTAESFGGLTWLGKVTPELFGKKGGK